MIEAMASMKESSREAMTLKEPVKNQAVNFIPISSSAVATEAKVASFSREAFFSSGEIRFILPILFHFSSSGQELFATRVNSCGAIFLAVISYHVLAKILGWRRHQLSFISVFW
jgi:hypothetical protein